MELGLAGKVAIITGGASGLGKEIAREFLAEGASVALVDYNRETLEATATELGNDETVRGYELDVRDYAACQAVVAQVAADLGPVDILVNSAGIGGPMSFFAQAEPPDWQDLLDINLRGVINCCRAVTDTMVARGSGKIVSIASEAGKANEKRMVVYGATKGGVISLTRGLATELGRHNINVNAVCPGVTKTPMTAYIDEELERRSSQFYPLGRLGEPQDIAPMVVFLCSAKTSWVTGQAISVSGGFGRS